MTWTKQLKTITAVLPMAALLALPSSGSAQYAVTRAAVSSVDVSQARVLEARAKTLLEDSEGWAEAVDLYRQAANLRPAGDEVATENLMMAGKLAFYTGDGLRALVDLQTAAAQALVCDKPFHAAQAYLDAAWVANELDMKDDRDLFVAQANRIATYHDLTRWEKDEIQRRMHGED
jgi:hypothetical protein